MVKKLKEPAPSAERQTRTRSPAAGHVSDGPWDKLEQVFEDRVARALATIGVPTRNDVEALSRQVEQLGLMVAQLSGQAAPSAKKAPAAKVARKAAVKTATRTGARQVAKAAAGKAAPRKAATSTRDGGT